MLRYTIPCCKKPNTKNVMQNLAACKPDGQMINVKMPQDHVTQETSIRQPDANVTWLREVSMLNTSYLWIEKHQSACIINTQRRRRRKETLYLTYSHSMKILTQICSCMLCNSATMYNHLMTSPPLQQGESIHGICTLIIQKALSAAWGAGTPNSALPL